ncbi:MAG TPA: hypothetical protein ENJ32_04070 [Crenotrichaceae bacterium]|nr:hypothetical protein [Crenotrichaceae bacterium]
MNQYVTRFITDTLLVILTVISPVTMALNIQIDYSLDSNGFFDPATQQGIYARQTLESVADYFSELLTDQFTAIASSENNQFTVVFQHPSDTYFVEMPRLDIPQDTIIIFVGARDLHGTLLGYAGVGGYNAQGNASFLNNIETRGQSGITHGDDADDFAPWGGYLSFDLYANWYFDDDLSTADVPAEQFDFYSNALHEFGHLLGIGTSDAWFRLTAYSYFDGERTNFEYNDLIPLDNTLEHWAQDVENNVQGATQTASLTPALKPGERKQFTKLDIAALEDIGWVTQRHQQTLENKLADGALTIPDDFNLDGHPDLIWRDPTTGQLTITYLDWKQTDEGLTAHQIEQKEWINFDDTDWQLIAVEHLDSDQHPDLVWWHQKSGEIAIWYMNQTAIKLIHSPFQNRPVENWKPVDVTDFDNDGVADIVWWNQQLSQAEIWYINQWGSETTQVAGISQTFQSEQLDDELIATADFDDNTTPDLVFVNKRTQRYTLWSMAQQTVIAIKPLPWTLDATTQLIATKDYNLDGTPDLLIQAKNPENQQTTVLTLISLKDLATAKSQTDLRFAIPSAKMNSVN